MQITTTLGLLEESELIKTERSFENENEKTTSVEYCSKDCDGPAHNTGQPDSESYFCSKHIHRSAHVHLKKHPAMTGEAGKFQ